MCLRIYDLIIRFYTSDRGDAQVLTGPKMAYILKDIFPNLNENLAKSIRFQVMKASNAIIPEGRLSLPHSDASSIIDFTDVILLYMQKREI